MGSEDISKLLLGLSPEDNVYGNKDKESFRSNFTVTVGNKDRNVINDKDYRDIGTKVLDHEVVRKMGHGHTNTTKDVGNKPSKQG